MDRFNSIIDTIASAIEWLVAILLAVLISITAVQVFNRYFLQFSYAWAEELSKLIFFYLVFLGGALAINKGTFSAFELYKLMRVEWQKNIRIFIWLLILCFQVVAAFYGGVMVSLTTTQITPALEVSQAFAYGAIPFGMVFMILMTVHKLMHELQGEGS